MAANLDQLDPQVRQRLMIALDELRRRGINYNVTSGYRSSEKQAELWRDRATNPFPVAPPGTSKHERGLAFDMTLADESQRPAANTVMEKHGFRWGGTFKRPDPIHYEMGGAAPVDPYEAQHQASVEKAARTFVERGQAAPRGQRRQTADPVQQLADRFINRAPKPRPTNVDPDVAAAAHRFVNRTAPSPSQSPRTAGLGQTPTLPAQSAMDFAGTIGDMFAAVPRAGGALLDQLNRVDNAATAAVNTLATRTKQSMDTRRKRRQQGASFAEQAAQNLVPFAGGAHNFGEAFGNMAGALGQAGHEAERVYHAGETVPPRALRIMAGATREQTPGVVYWPLTAADIYAGFRFAPSGKILGPLQDRAVTAAGKLVGPAVRGGVKLLGQAARPVERIMAGKLPRVAAGALAAPDETRRMGVKGLEILSRATGSFKKAMVSNPATQITNIGSNLAASSLAAERAGVNPALIFQHLPTAAKEAAAAARGHLSADVREFSQYSGAFSGTLGSTTQVAGVTGNRFTRALGAAGNTLTNFHSLSEQASKLALFKALKGKVGAKEAARLVEQHLFDYNDIPRLLATGEKYGLAVFGTYPYKATLLLGDTLLHRPDLLARFPRIQKELLQAAGAEKGYSQLGEHQQGTFVIPVGKNRFVDLSRWHPFAAGLDTLHQVANGGGLLPTSSEELLDAMMGRTLASGVYSALANRNLLSHRPLMKPGLPPDMKLQRQVEALQESYSPSLLPPAGRGFQRLRAAAEGRPVTPGPFGQAQPLGEAVSQSIFGIPVYRGESFDTRKERLAPKIEQRAAQADAWLDQVGAEIDSGRLPVTPGYTARAAHETDPRQIHRLAQDANARLREMREDASLYDREGRLTMDGKARLRRMLEWRTALTKRLEMLPQQ